MAGSVIQATGPVEYENGSRVGNHLKAGVLLGFLCGQTEFQYGWVCVAAWCQARRRAQFLAAMVLGLTWPSEVGMFVLFPDMRQSH